VVESDASVDDKGEEFCRLLLLMERTVFRAHRRFPLLLCCVCFLLGGVGGQILFNIQIFRLSYAILNFAPESFRD